MTEAINIEANFKSTLPPRKRARTKEEKEQRRVERILRNRRAAHASREKKRKHVEFLENYVLKLEENMRKLQSNFDIACKSLSSSKLALIKFEALEDVEELKVNIHSNLSSTPSVTDEDEAHDRKKLRLEASEVNESASETMSEVAIKEEHTREADNELLSISNDNLFFNYLSPISITSPVNSPIDLTLKKSDDSMHSSFSDQEGSHDLGSLKEYDSMGQNSAAPVVASFAESNEGTFLEETNVAFENQEDPKVLDQTNWFDLDHLASLDEGSTGPKNDVLNNFNLEEFLSI